MMALLALPQAQALRPEAHLLQRLLAGDVKRRGPLLQCRHHLQQQRGFADARFPDNG